MSRAALAVALLLVAAGAAAAPAQRVYVGIYLHDVSKFDQKDGVFDVDAELWAKWRGDFDPKQLVVANAGEVQQEALSSEADGDWHSARWRLRGTLRGEFPLHRYPFDAQTLAVTFELPDHVGELVPDLASSGMREHFSVTGWFYDPTFRPRIVRDVYRSDLGRLAGEGQPTPVHRVSFEVTLRRPPVAVSLKLLLPLAIILLVALVALFIAPEEIEARVGIGITSLLACFAFQFSVADTLPNVSYLTLADTMFIVVYIATAIAVAVTVLGYHLQRRGRESGANTLDRVARVLIPIGAIIPALIVSLPRALPQPAGPPLPSMSRPRSTRDVLRIGAINLSNLLASPVEPGVSWPLAKKVPGGRRLPVFVEAVPDISNELLRFIAGGQLEVTWRLRPEARWSDGSPLTSADLLLSAKLWPDADMVDVRAPDPRTLVLRFGDRVARALEPPGFLHRSLEAVHRQRGYEPFMEHLRGTPTPSMGPYRIVELRKGERLVAEVNPHFIGPPPSIRKVTVMRFAGGAALAQAFLRREIDIAVPNSTTPEQTRGLAAKRPDAVRIRPSRIYIYLQVDLTHPLLRRRAVRHALLMAIDRARLRSEVYGEAGRVAHVPSPGPTPPRAREVSFDPAGAREILRKEGALGMKLPLFTSKSEVNSMITARLVEDLRAAGIDVQTQVVENTAALYRKRRHGGLLHWAMRATDDTDPRAYWNIPLRNGRYLNEARNDAYTDEVAALVARHKRALYPERRGQLREAIFVEYTERLPQLPLLFASERLVVDPALRGWDHGVEADFGEGLESWYFEDARGPGPQARNR